MIKTPRTDIETKGSEALVPKNGEQWVYADFARQLEARLADALAEIERLKVSEFLRDIKTPRNDIERKDKLIERIYETLKNVIQSADAEWESKNLGHDWQEACQSMRAALELVEKEMR